MRLRSSHLSAVLAAALLGVAPACKKAETTAPGHQDDDLDRAVEDLVWQLRVGGRGELDKTYPDIAAEIDDRDLAVLSRTLEWLGQESRFERTGEQPIVDGVERRYKIELARGKIELTVTVIGGKIEGFSFDEASWTSYVDQSAAAAAGDLRVSDFRYVDKQGKPLTGKLDPMGINYELVLEGLGARFREHHVAIGKAVFDAGGHQVYKQPEPDEIRFSQSETGASGGRISGTVKVPGPGRYELELHIRDLTVEQTLTHRVGFTVE